MGEIWKPMIGGKLMDAMCYVGSDGLSSESAMSPRSPLDLLILSPRGMIKSDFGGIGLGIVAAMDNGRHFRCTTKDGFGPTGGDEDVDDEDVDDEEEGVDDEDEDYTCVISHGGPNKTFSRRVYLHDHIRKRAHNTNTNTNNKKPTFYISQHGFFHDLPSHASDSFLSFCGICRKGLQGRDVYMYRGERGFCSEECRDGEIAMEAKAGSTDGRSEQIWSGVAERNRVV